MCHVIESHKVCLLIFISNHTYKNKIKNVAKENQVYTLLNMSLRLTSFQENRPRVSTPSKEKKAVIKFRKKFLRNSKKL